jgi:hypothetical protein
MPVAVASPFGSRPVGSGVAAIPIATRTAIAVAPASIPAAPFAATRLASLGRRSSLRHRRAELRPTFFRLAAFFHPVLGIVRAFSRLFLFEVIRVGDFDGVVLILFEKVLVELVVFLFHRRIGMCQVIDSYLAQHHAQIGRMIQRLLLLRIVMPRM